MLTRDEEILLKRLSVRPICTHSIHASDIIDLGNSWKCNLCGLIALKRTVVVSDAVKKVIGQYGEALKNLADR